MGRPLTAGEAGRLLDVSRETLDRLQIYLELLQVWQRRINLVGPRPLPIHGVGILWTAASSGACGRQARVSWPISAAAPGCPGLILAVLGAPVTHLIESDRRKAAFLREAARACGATVTVHAARIERGAAVAGRCDHGTCLGATDQPADAGRTPYAARAPPACFSRAATRRVN